MRESDGSGLFLAWAVHDAEEWFTIGPWSRNRATGALPSPVARVVPWAAHGVSDGRAHGRGEPVRTTHEGCIADLPSQCRGVRVSRSRAPSGLSGGAWIHTWPGHDSNHRASICGVVGPAPHTSVRPFGLACPGSRPGWGCSFPRRLPCRGFCSGSCAARKRPLLRRNRRGLKRRPNHAHHVGGRVT
jgi:hypothetical protein